jgi:hypothetical protein
MKNLEGKPLALQEAEKTNDKMLRLTGPPDPK